MKSEVQYAIDVIRDNSNCEVVKIGSPVSTMWIVRDHIGGLTDTYILSHFNGVNQLMNVWTDSDGKIIAEEIDLVDLQEWAISVQNRAVELTD